MGNGARVPFSTALWGWPSLCAPSSGLILRRGTGRGDLLLQGLLKVEVVAPSVSPGRTEAGSHRVDVCGDDRRDRCGALTSLGMADGHPLLRRCPGFLGELEPAGL